MKKNLSFFFILLQIILLQTPLFAFEGGVGDELPLSNYTICLCLGIALALGIISSLLTIKYDGPWPFVVSAFVGEIIVLILSQNDGPIFLISFVVFLASYFYLGIIFTWLGDKISSLKKLRRKKNKLILPSLIGLLIPGQLLAASINMADFTLVNGFWLCIGICALAGFLTELIPLLSDTDAAQPIFHLAAMVIGAILVALFFKDLNTSLVAFIAYIIGWVLVQLSPFAKVGEY